MIDLLGLKRGLLPYRGLLKKDGPDNEGANAAALANAQLAREQYEWFKNEYARTAPQREESTRIANESAQIQNRITKQQADQSEDTYKYQTGTFRPIEQRLAEEAQSFDTEQRRDQEAADATAEVRGAYDAQRAQMADSLSGVGVAPGSGAYMGSMRKLAVSQAGQEASAANTARKNVESQGWARMSDVASLGRNIASSQATNAQIATNAGSAAAGSASTANNINTSGANLMQTGFSGAMQGNASAGSIYNQAASIKSQSEGDLLSGIAGLGMAGAKMYTALSDKNMKKGTGKKADTASMLEAVKSIPVHEGWSYDPTKGGPDDGGQPHDGPMAQDVRREMGNDVAPDGKRIDLVSMNGRMMAAIQELAKRQERLEKKVS